MAKVESDILIGRRGRWCEINDDDEPYFIEGRVELICDIQKGCLMRLDDGSTQWIDFKHIMMEMVCETCLGNGFQSHDCPDCGL